MKKYDVSIIVPVYNTEKYLSKCLDSILNQSHNNIEIILINDGSTDSSLNIIREYSEKYENIVVINQVNKGQGEARNQGIKISSADYITFVDSDDWISEDYIKILYTSVIDNDADISVGNIIGVLSNNMKNIHYPKFKYCELIGKDAVSYLLLDKELKSYPCAKLFKKNLFINNEIAFPGKMYYEDLAVVMQSTFYANKVILLNKYIYYYLQNNESSTRTPNMKNITDRLKALTIIKEFFIKNKCFEFYSDRYRHFCLFHLYLIINQINDWNFKISYDEIIQYIVNLIEVDFSKKLINNTQLDKEIKSNLIILKSNKYLYKIYWFLQKAYKKIMKTIINVWR